MVKLGFSTVRRFSWAIWLVAVIIGGCWYQQQEQPSSQWDQVAMRGEWRVAIAADLLPASNAFDASPDLVLARQFATSQQLKLKILPFDSLVQARELLLRGEVDALIAVPATSEQLTGLQQTRSYQEVPYQLVFKNGAHRGRHWNEIDGDLKVPAGSRASELLLQAKAEQPALLWTESQQSHRELLAEIIDETLAYTVAPGPVLALERSLHPELMTGLVLSRSEPWVWAFPGSDDSLAERADQFLAEAIEDGTVSALYEELIEPVASYDYYEGRQFVDAMLERLPELQPHFVRAAKQDLDWRLLAAIAYQESHWREEAVSVTGVRGIMMLTEDTAERMGVTDRTDPEQSIHGGADYFRTMHDTIPDRIAEPDRTWFTLAAYNIGFAHLEDARILTERLGDNPDRWDDVKKHLPKLRDPAVYKTLKRGYARGEEPVHFVHGIQRYYATLRLLPDQLDSTQMRRMAGEPARRVSPLPAIDTAEPVAVPLIAAGQLPPATVAQGFVAD